ncbi:hypothetical protein BGY98DRAFT_655667 [Russula aff. rugulosa BPL654]|nr:hypothetical protein BGY98DRAFT_655667 [Russula aff. rugulosa BPL654]
MGGHTIFVDDGAPRIHNNGQRPSPPPPSRDVMCIIPGCRNRAFVDSDGNATKFCSNRHRLAAVQLGLADVCLFCKEMPTVEVGSKQSDFCSKHCSMAALSRVPTILEVPVRNENIRRVSHDRGSPCAPDDGNFNPVVVDQFTKQWKHPTQKPTVIKVWRIFGHRPVLDQFYRYQLEVERRTGIHGGNTRRRFHGTVRECTLGDTSRDGNLCAQTSCNMCRIIESSFQRARALERTNFGRFGEGIYTSATSSKANAYYDGNASPNRAMLLNDVVMGKAIKLRTTDESLMEPPPGYDAVIGEPGGDLNYDECIVYKNDAIRASFLIVYK